MTGRNLLRAGGRVALPLGIAAVVAGMAAAPVLAAGSNLSVTRGDGSDATASATTSDTCIHVDGTIPASLSGATTSMVIVDAQGQSHSAGSVRAAATANRSLSFQFSTTQLSWGGGCGAGSGQAVNGTYQARLTGGVNASVSFRLAIPPAAPTGFDATARGTVVTFSWNPNSEPDLAGYDIVDESTGTDVTSGGVDAGSVCDSGGCSVSVDFGSSAQGTTHAFHVLALRHTAPGSAGYLDSAPSASRTVQFAAAPSPSGSPAGGSGSGNGAGGGTSGGTATGGGHTGGHTGGSGKRLSGKPSADLRASLPTYTAGSAPDLPSVLTEVKPLPQGTYKPTLAYPDQVKREAAGRRAGLGPASGVVHDIARVLDTSALWQGLGGAAVLLLVAAHLHTWVRHTADGGPESF